MNIERLLVISQAILFFARRGYRRVRLDYFLWWGGIAKKKLDFISFDGITAEDFNLFFKKFPEYAVYNSEAREVWINDNDYYLCLLETCFTHTLPSNIYESFLEINLECEESLPSMNGYGPKEEGILLAYDSKYNRVQVLNKPKKLLYKKKRMPQNELEHFLL